MADPDLKKLDLPWIVNLSLFALCLGVDISRFFRSPILRFIMLFFDYKSFPSKKPVNGVTSTDITIDKSRNLWFRLYTPTPTGDVTMPVIFYFHGGGFCYLAPHSRPYNHYCHRLSGKLNAIIISVNYRLAPEHRYPAPYEDAFDALKFIDEMKMEGFPIHANLKHCFLAGDSAGANIAHNVMVRASKHDFRSIKIIGAMIIQPFFGGEEWTESELALNKKVPFGNISAAAWLWKSFLPKGSNRDHPASNVFGPNSDDISELKLPASIVFVAGFDPLKDRQKRYYEGMKKSGKETYLIEYPNTFHSFYIYSRLAVYPLFVKDLKDFMQKQMTAAGR